MGVNWCAEDAGKATNFGPRRARENAEKGIGVADELANLSIERMRRRRWT
jgi:hypothetical protein